MFLYESPYPVALRKEVKGFIQIPLGNNIFVGAYWKSELQPEHGLDCRAARASR